MATQVTHNNDGHFYTIDVDLAKEGAEVFDLTTYFKARVADNNVGLRFRWFWQGQVFNTVGKKPRVVGLVGQYSFKKADDGTNRELVMSPDASSVAFTGDVNDCEPGGYATYYFPEQMFPQDGMFKGTVGLLDDSGETARYTSVDIWFKVYPQAGGAQMGKACDYYIDELDKAIKEAEEDLKAGQKSQQQIIDEYQQKVTDLVNQLNTQGQTANSMMETVKAGLTALETKIKQDGLFTQAEADAFKQEILKSIFKTVQKYRTVAAMVADSNLKEGSYVETAGYYEFADGGGAKYLIVDSKPATPSVALTNGLYAELITEDCINIKQLGAKGDGITDDSDVFRQAIALGIPIQVPIGQYKFNSTVELHAKDGDSVTIYGLMPISTWNAVAKKPIIVSPENDYAFRGLRGKVTSKFHNICFSGYGADALSGSNIINCEFMGHIGLHDFRVSSVTLSSFHDCDVAGLQKSTDSKVTNNYFYNNAIGIDYSTSNDDVTTNNKIEWNGIGISFSNAEDHIVSDNIFDRNTTYGITMNDFRRSIVTGNFFERNLAAHLQIIKASGIQISTNRFAFKNSEDDGTGTDLPLNALEVTDFQNVKFSDSQFSIPKGGKIFKEAPKASPMVTFDNITVNGINLQKLGFYTTNSITYPTGSTTRSWSWTDINTNLGLPDLFHGDDYSVRGTALYLGDEDPNVYTENYHLNVYTNFNSLNFMYDNVTEKSVEFSHAYALLEPKFSFYTKYVAP
nr:NosD domain-containing protein [Limosilactobacillus mucosae]